MLALLACVLLLTGVAAGCKSASKDPATDKKAMLEAVANWQVAQGKLDLAGVKAGIYDPSDIFGIATMTAVPEGVAAYEVKWEWVGDTIVLAVPSQQATVTLSASPAQANVVLLKDTGGQGQTLVMKQVDDAWKIDVAETQKITQAGSGEPTSTPAPKP